MKVRLHDKKAGVTILAVLMVLSLAEVIFHLVYAHSLVGTATDLGDPLAITLFAGIIILLTAKGKHRICYICYGAWLSYFVLYQVFELPGLISTIISLMSESGWAIAIGDIALLLRAFSMVGIIAIGALLVEYMNDGTIYNRAFNKVCIATVIMLSLNVIISLYDIINGAHIRILLEVFNNLSRITMVFLFTFFAYDSAKLELKKVKLSK